MGVQLLQSYYGGTAVTVVLWGYSCKSRTMRVQLLQSYYEGTAVTVVIWGYSCKSRTMGVQLLQSYYEGTAVRVVLWGYSCKSRTMRVQLLQSYYEGTAVQSYYEEHVTLHISDTGRHKRSGGGVISFPDDLGIHFDTENSSVSLSLRRNYALNENVPVYVIEENGIVQQNLPVVTDTAYYQDVEHGAAFTVKFDEKTSKVSNLFGTLRLRNANYFLERSGDIDSNDNSQFRLRKYKVKAGMVVDFVRKKVDDFVGEKDDTTYLGESRNRGKTGSGRRLDDRIPPIPSPRVKRAAVQQTVEIMITSDHTIYSYWYDDSNATSTAQKDTDAMASIRQHYAHSMNEIDTMYASIDSSSISIKTVFACMVVSKSTTTSEWTVPRVSDGKVDSSEVLNNFTAWERQALLNCSYDHAMLFSRYDFTATVNGVVSDSNAGLAWLSAACRTFKQSITEYSFDTSMNGVAAHELGHNLGADHDQDGNACLSNNKYIMAPSLGQGPSSARDNPWKFSTCSVTYFENYIATLDSSNNNCLLTLSDTHNSTALSPYDQEIPGQVTSADKQCVRLEGAGSHLCRELYSSGFSSMCYSMWCRKSNSNVCGGYTAATGTTCGNRKWCYQGYCVSNSTAPAVSDSCPYGDNPGVVYTAGNDTYTCATLFTSFGFNNCPTFYSSCCDTCSAYARSSQG
ncbi:zinc metalloproteinase-disintegrin VMP-II-like [Pecten maximus]|uniref:zinc metalloproteinase-disintegrin VMP-II-like n=1 Tax=Pecten maximus TaxID=6579 RepID=UPI00145843E3|nr:zinc metalloproteinase-disintegrin VMP-II-like [Pecten maximus]